MEHCREGDLLLVRLDRGEDVVPSLVRAMGMERARGAVLLTGLGALEDAEFAYFDPATKSYDRRVAKGSHELLSLSGIIAPGPDGAALPHLHITVAGRNHEALGGHLFSARVSVLAEFALRIVENPAMRREKEPEFGLNALRLR